mgnify:CR=1 FL=1
MSSPTGSVSRYVFTSESVTEGHPDKICDQVSDAVLDALLAQDPASRVACETVVNTGLCLITGEVTTTARVDFNTLVRGVINQIGYAGARAGGFDANSCAVLVALDQQSPDIAQGVDAKAAKGKKKAEQGAGDQGLMFGYASDETSVLMPAPIYYAHKILEVLAKARHAQEGGAANMDPEKIPEVQIRGDVNVPWKCIAGAIYNVQSAGYPKVGFIAEPLAVFSAHEGSITVDAQRDKAKKKALQAAYQAARRYYVVARAIKALRLDLLAGLGLFILRVGARIAYGFHSLFNRKRTRETP